MGLLVRLAALRALLLVTTAGAALYLASTGQTGAALFFAAVGTWKAARALRPAILGRRALSGPFTPHAGPGFKALIPPGWIVEGSEPDRLQLEGPGAFVSVRRVRASPARAVEAIITGWRGQMTVRDERPTSATVAGLAASGVRAAGASRDGAGHLLCVAAPLAEGCLLLASYRDAGVPRALIDRCVDGLARV